MIFFRELHVCTLLWELLQRHDDCIILYTSSAGGMPKRKIISAKMQKDLCECVKLVLLVVAFFCRRRGIGGCMDTAD